MPSLFNLGQHRSLQSINGRWRAKEKIIACLDDVYVVCDHLHVRTITKNVDEELFRCAHKNVHHGKTQMWNRGGAEPNGIAKIFTTAGWSIHRDSCGRVTRKCHPTKGGSGLIAKSEEQRLCRRIPLVADLQGHGCSYSVAEPNQPKFSGMPSSTTTTCGSVFPTHWVHKNWLKSRLNGVRIKGTAHWANWAYGASEPQRNREINGAWFGMGSCQLFHRRSKVRAVFGRYGSRPTKMGVHACRHQASIGNGRPNAAEDWLAEEKAIEQHLLQSVV